MELFFAHQGGWDEILMFAVPIVIAVLAVRWVERRNRNDVASPDENDATDGGSVPAITDKGDR